MFIMIYAVCCSFHAHSTLELVYFRSFVCRVVTRCSLGTLKFLDKWRNIFMVCDGCSKISD